MIKLLDLGTYDDAELVRKKMAAMLAFFVTEISPEDPILGQQEGQEQDSDGIDQVELQPGSMFKLKPGEDVKISPTAEVAGQYVEFMRVQLRAIAAALGITYEMLTGDLTGVNHSSIRHGVLEFRRRCTAIQWHILVHQFCQPVWNRWLNNAALAGVIDPRDYNQHRELYEQVEWQTPRWDWIDPLKDVRAEVEEIRAGFKSRETSVAQRGDDVEKVDEQIARDNQRSDALGLRFDSDGRQGVDKNAADSPSPGSDSSSQEPGTSAAPAPQGKEDQ